MGKYCKIIKKKQPWDSCYWCTGPNRLFYNNAFALFQTLHACGFGRIAMVGRLAYLTAYAACLFCFVPLLLVEEKTASTGSS
jgi:hypothetical protein